MVTQVSPAAGRITDFEPGNGKAAAPRQAVTIQPMNFKTAIFTITGTAPYVQNKFSAKAMEIMKAKQEAGSQGGKGTKRTAKDFKACYEGAMHKAKDGWCGLPAPAFRSAMISACRLVGFKMTLAKLSVFVEADGIDCEDGTPLVKITKGKPHQFEMAARNDNGSMDIRVRPMWDIGWTATVRVRYDADQFSLQDLTNLMERAGQQVGIGEGRPDSRNSAGLGWGMFTLAEKATEK